MARIDYTIAAHNHFQQQRHEGQRTDMTSATDGLHTANASTRGRRPGVVSILLVVLAAAVVFRYVKDKKDSADAIEYADMHEAVAIMHGYLHNATPEHALKTITDTLAHGSESMRYAALDALDAYADPSNRTRVEPLLETSYRDCSAEVRKKALELMVRLDIDRGYRLELAAMRDEDAWLRDDAALLLTVTIGRKDSPLDKRAIPVLMAALDDVDDSIPPLAMSVLKSITGNHWRYNIHADQQTRDRIKSQWKSWWATEQKHWKQEDLVVAQPVTPERADPAPDFSVRDLDGNRITLDSLKGKVTVINFWGTWCAPCQMEMPALARIESEYRGTGLKMIGVAAHEDSPDSLRKWCNAHGIGYSQVVQAERMTTVFGNVHEVPVSFIIDRQGRIRRRFDGERDYTTFKLALDRILKD